MVKEESNPRKFERPKDLDLISKLSSKHQNQKLKTIIKLMNMKAIFAVMKLIWSIVTVHSYKLQTLTFNLHRNCLGAVINQERKLQLKNELNFTMKMKHS